jgi:hypothetical protein
MAFGRFSSSHQDQVVSGNFRRGAAVGGPDARPPAQPQIRRAAPARARTAALTGRTVGILEFDAAYRTSDVQSYFQDIAKLAGSGVAFVGIEGGVRVVQLPRAAPERATLAQRLLAAAPGALSWLTGRHQAPSVS